MGYKKLKLGTIATPAQTKRWVTCLTQWAKVNNKTHADIAEIIGFSASSWYRLIRGINKRTRLSYITSSTRQLGLDADYINGIFDFKNRFSEYKNIFTDFKELYAQYSRQGNNYQASQIVRKAAVFIYETLVPKDMILSLSLVNRNNEYETAEIHCSSNEIDFYVITIYGGAACVMFTLSKKMGSFNMPIMEGDLDTHAVSAIKHQVSVGKKKYYKSQKSVAKFTDNAKKFAI